MGDTTVAAAILDGLLHYARCSINGESYRMRVHIATHQSAPTRDYSWRESHDYTRGIRVIFDTMLAAARRH